MTLPTDYVDGDILTAADVNAITTAVNGNIPASTIAAKGDLLVGLTNDSVGVLTAGTNGYLLSASSGATSGLEWVSAPGKVLKFAYAEDANSRTTTSGSNQDITNISISFTPTSASSYLLIELSAIVFVNTTSNIDDRAGIIGIDYNAGAETYEAAMGRILVAASTQPANSFASNTCRVVVASANTSARTIKGFFKSTNGETVQLVGTNTPTTLTVTEVSI